MKQMQVNAKFMPFVTAKNYWTILWGGAGSGKSRAAVQKIMMRCLSERNHTFLVVRKTQKSIRSTVLKEFRDAINLIDAQPMFEITESPSRIYCKSTNSQIIFNGCDDAEKLKSLAGITGIWIEEVTELNEEEFNQVVMRMRTNIGQYLQVILTFNPVDENHWIKRRFFDMETEDCLKIHSTWRDNPFIAKAAVKYYESLKDVNKRQYDIYYNGLWGSVTDSNIITNFKIEGININPYTYSKAVCGIDFGFSHLSAVLCVAKLTENDNKLYILKEIVANNITNYELWEKINAESTIKDLEFVCDSAEPDRIRELQLLGLNARAAKKGPGSVNLGIDFLQRNEIIIHPDCKKTIEEIKSWRWKTKDGKVITPPSPYPYNDDTVAALRYATESFYLGGMAQMKLISGLRY